MNAHVNAHYRESRKNKEIVEKFKYTQSMYKIKFHVNTNWKREMKEKKNEQK